MNVSIIYKVKTNAFKWIRLDCEFPYSIFSPFNGAFLQPPLLKVYNYFSINGIKRNGVAALYLLWIKSLYFFIIVQITYFVYVRKILISTLRVIPLFHLAFFILTVVLLAWKAFCFSRGNVLYFLYIFPSSKSTKSLYTAPNFTQSCNRIEFSRN